MRRKEWNVWAKLRAAVRDVYRYSPTRREHLKAAIKDGSFSCAICYKPWPKELAEDDHEPPLGSFNSWDTFADWTKRMFEGPTQIVCKMCHKKKSAQQRKRI